MVVGKGLIPVASSKKSIGLSLIILSSTLVPLESVPSIDTEPSAAATSCRSFAPASVLSESVPSIVILLLLPNSSFNIGEPLSVPELSVALSKNNPVKSPLSTTSKDAFVVRISPIPDLTDTVLLEFSPKILSN